MRLASALVALTLAASVLPSPASASNEIRAFQLVTPEEGWILQGNRLLWSDVLGTQKKEITPPLASKIEIDAVFFVTPTAGWCLLSSPMDDLAQLSYWVAATTDQGRTWFNTALPSPADYPTQQLSSNGKLFFADQSHGWLQIQMQSSSAESWGKLLVTQDGGTKWTKLPNPPIYGELHFNTPTFGWLVGGTGIDHLYLSRDGGVHWTEAALVPALSFDEPTSRISYGEPCFSTPQDGILPTTYDLENRDLFVTYRTQDGGATWQTGPVEDPWPGTKYASRATVHSHVVRVLYRPTLGRFFFLTPAAAVSASLPSGWSINGQIGRLSFADDSHGWFQYYGYPGGDCLLATVDGGNTITAIELDPPAAPPATRPTITRLQ